MAKKLKEFDFNERVLYPWDFWLNGEIWQLTEEDIGDTNLENFRIQVHGNARIRGLKVITKIDPVNRTLTFQTRND